MSSAMRETTGNPDDFERVKISLRARMTVNAFRHLSRIHARTGAVLAPSGFLEHDPSLRSVPEPILAAMTASEDGVRVPAPPGPLLFYLEGDPPRRIAMPMDAFLLNADVNGRRAAVAHFAALAGTGESVLSVASERALELEAAAVTSAEPGTWERSAVRLYDALNDDFLLALAGFYQSEKFSYQGGMNSYAERLLWPGIRSFERMQLEVEAPSTQSDELNAIVERCLAGPDTLKGALDSWFDSVGYLPIAPGRGLGRIAKHFLDPLGIEELSDQLRRWADGHTSPLATAHVCLAFLADPSLLHPGSYHWLWSAVTSIALPGPVEEEEGQIAAWKIRIDLALHYQYLLECSAPGHDSERIANLSMWLSEKVGCAFGKDEAHLELVRQRVVKPALEHSRRAWLLVHPSVTPSPLRYAVLHARSGWACSLLCHSGELSVWVRALTEAYPDAEAMRSTVLVTTFECFPLPAIDEDAEGTYAFESSLKGALAAWGVPLEGGDGDTETSAKFISFYGSARDESELQRKLTALPTSNIADQIYICNLVRSLAYCGVLPDDLLWGFVSDHEWFKKVATNVGMHPLECIIDALADHQNQRGGRWICGLPHSLALAIGEVQGEDRRRTLFTLAIMSSISAGTTSAIARLMRNAVGPPLHAEAAVWKRVLRSVQKFSTPYVHARLRPLLSVFGRWLGEDDLAEQPEQVAAASEADGSALTDAGRSEEKGEGEEPDRAPYDIGPQ